jgi:hypothetical protein
MTGRIYRVAPAGHKAVAPNMDLSSAAGAVQALKSPNLATRYLAWEKLKGMEKLDAVLQSTWRGDDAFLGARAWQLLVRHDEKKYIDAAVRDRHPGIRSLALRYMRVEEKDPIPVVRRLVNDPNPRVRAECALSLHRSESSEAPEPWAELAQQHDGQDRWYLEALGIGAYGQDDRFFDAWLKKVGDNWNTPGGRDIVWRTRASKAPALIVRIIQDANTPQSEKDKYFRALDFIRGPEKDAALVELLTQ